VEKSLYLENKTIPELGKILERWILVLEILTHITCLKKLDLSMSVLAELTQTSYKGGWN
jgi:hypothetical protein